MIASHIQFYKSPKFHSERLVHSIQLTQMLNFWLQLSSFGAPMELLIKIEIFWKTSRVNLIKMCFELGEMIMTYSLLKFPYIARKRPNPPNIFNIKVLCKSPTSFLLISSFWWNGVPYFVKKYLKPVQPVTNLIILKAVEDTA